MRINTNVSSLTAQESASNTSKTLASSLEKLSSGLRINKASDDASGLAIADKLRTQATSINQGVANGNSAITLLQIADKSMAEQSNILDTIKAKLIQANTDTTSADGRESIRKDIKKLLEQLDNIAEQTNYNGNVLLQKSATSKLGSNDLSFQVGETNRDIITNTSIQSNTDGLGSKISYGTSEAVANGSSLLVAATGAITIKASGSTMTEKVSLNGDVDSLTLAVGAKVSGVDTATKAKLDALVTSGKATLSSGTYTIGSTAQTLDLSAATGAITATIETAKSASFSATSIATGQVVDVRGVTLTSGSDLKVSLNDSNLFTKLTTGVYVSVKGTTIDELKSGESFKLVTTTNVAQGSTSATFNAGDVIKVNTKVTGGLLDKALSTTGMFKKNTDGTYTVLENFTAGNLRLMTGESISITQGNAVSLGSSASAGIIATGLTLTNLKYNPGGNTASATTVYQATSNFNNLKLGAATAAGTQLYAAGEDTISFTVTATGQVVASAKNFSVKQGDIISFASAEAAGTGGVKSLSSGLMETTNFIAIGSGKFQALKDTTVKMDGADSINVTRLVGGVATPKVHSADAANTVTKEKALTDQTITFTSTNGVTLTNNSGAAEKLTLSTSTADITNGKNSLASLSALAEGELTTTVASSFQSVVDDAITKLNGYRGDIGSTQNQVESAVRNLMTQATNVKAAESIIRDVDYAAESANFNKQNIISQAGSYAISQANAVQQNVLKLLQ